MIINCPNCKTNFELAEAVGKEYRDTIRTELTAKWKEEKAKFAAREQELLAKEESIVKQVQELAAKQLAEKEAELNKRIEEKYSLQMDNLKKTQEEDRERIKSLSQFQIENEKLKRENKEQKQAIELEFERKLNDALKEKEAKLKEIVAAEAEKEVTAQKLKIEEQNQVVESLKSKIEDLQKRANQGSMQLQGEAQELLIETELRTQFPFDVIEEVGKGQRGADCIQLVRNAAMQHCGRIIWESKRTKDWSNDWIDKLKGDMLAAKADVAILVSSVMPKKTDSKVEEIDGIWVCHISYFKPMAAVFRDRMLKVHQAFESQQSKGDKMQMLYDYLMGSEFKMQMQGIMNGFENIRKSYDDEKKALMKLWKKRDKELEVILENATSFIGSLDGIAGNNFSHSLGLGSTLGALADAIDEAED